MSMKQASTWLSMVDTRKINIQFKNLSYEIQGYRGRKKQILKDLNGFFKSGELTAIMGPSGAGKSTLLNILSGFHHGQLTGTLEYIDSEGRQNCSKYKKQICYIQQTDYLYDLLTVQENMIIAAYLKIGTNVTQKYRKMIIEGILDTLNLSKIKDTRIDKISGGQKKRMSIALELINNPSIMFLDEPTTGLDSLSSLQCITVLQTLAKSGRMVICTIHQPSAAIYHMFDHIYLVVEGHCMYASSSDNTISYFARQGLQCPKYHNPADYMLEVVSQEYGDFNNQLIAAAKQYCRREESPSKLHIIKEASLNNMQMRMLSKISPPSEMVRFRILIYRYIQLLYRDWKSTYMKIFFHFVLAILLGLLFEHAGENGNQSISNLSFMAITGIFMAYTTMMPAILKFPLELATLKKEQFNNWYQLKTYYAATLAISIPMQILFSFIFTSISYIMSSQPLEWCRFFMFLLISILTGIVSESVGFGLGTIFNPINGTFVGAIIMAVMLVLSGFLIMFNHISMIFYYVTYLNYFRFAFDGYVQAIYGFHREKLNCPRDIVYCHLRSPSLILEEMKMATSKFWLDVVVLFIWLVIIKIMVYVTLKKRLSEF